MAGLPRVSGYVSDAVMQWLRDRENMLRPPEATAKFLVLCVKLHQRGEPFPPRKEAAEHLNVSVALIDTALSQRSATKDIRIELAFTPGFVKRRLSTKRHRMVIPSDELIKLVVETEAREKARRAGRSSIEV